MMAVVTGAHAIIYSRKPEADRAFLRDILGLPHVDIGEGWLIFGLPPAELAVHPSAKNNVHEIYFICKDIDTFMAAMKRKGVSCSAIQTLSWGKRTQIRLPGGGKLGVYEARHARPTAAKVRKKTGVSGAKRRTA
jgi:catechol 2,3-dioxygenase-like lactoylglutathione lyase family enzyme